MMRPHWNQQTIEATFGAGRGKEEDDDDDDDAEVRSSAEIDLPGSTSSLYRAVLGFWSVPGEYLNLIAGSLKEQGRPG